MVNCNPVLECELIRGEPKMTKWLYALAGLVIVFSGQQCSKVDLEHFEKVNFLSISPNPLRLDPPIDLPQIRRILFFVDMSYSMVSGPCPQDIDENMVNWTTPFDIYDPNKGTGNPNDHRADGIDCIVDKNLPLTRSAIQINDPNIQSNPRVYYRTHLGMDYEKRRFKILRNWLDRARNHNTPALIQNTRIMIVPFSGGKAQAYLENRWKEVTGQSEMISFFDLTDPRLDQILNWLEEEHDTNLELAQLDDVWRYEKRTLGTSSPGGYFQKVYEILQNDMRIQNQAGELAFTDYQMIPITDGNLTPIKDHIQRTLRFFSPCAPCADNPASCNSISTTCGGLVTRLEQAWGFESDNDLNKMDFNLGLIQSLPNYFGSGYLSLDFVQINEYRYQATNPGKVTFFKQLEPLFKKRKAKIKVWPGNSDEPPFKLVSDTGLSSSFKMTDLYLLNLNYRMNSSGKMELDSDGDGVSDDLEMELGLNPRNSRSNNYVLDSLVARSAFRERASALATSNSCDPTLDTDGDSLNECEESLIGTDPFDFDSDSDAIPDSWEWLYGLNPLIPDDNLDSNGDGITNKIALSVGLPPQPIITSIHESAISRYEVNYKGKEQIDHPAFGNMLVELFEVIVHGIPVRQGLVSQNDFALFSSRVSLDPSAREKNRIPYEEQLISAITDQRYNVITGLARITSTSNPERVYWRIYKTQIPLSNVYSQPRLDLSLFKQVRARDRND